MYCWPYYYAHSISKERTLALIEVFLRKCYENPLGPNYFVYMPFSGVAFTALKGCSATYSAQPLAVTLSDPLKNNEDETESFLRRLRLLSCEDLKDVTFWSSAGTSRAWTLLQDVRSTTRMSWDLLCMRWDLLSANYEHRHVISYERRANHWGWLLLAAFISCMQIEYSI